MSAAKRLAMIAAVGPNLELGSRGDLVWHISADLKNFKKLTMGHPVIMGRKTWESLPNRPLPGRLNVVVSHAMWNLEGAVCVQTPQEALEACREEEMPFVIGGAQVYRTLLPLADELYITHIHSVPDKVADCWMPDYREDFMLIEASEWAADPKGVRYRFERWIRK